MGGLDAEVDNVQQKLLINNDWRGRLGRVKFSQNDDDIGLSLPPVLPTLKPHKNNKAPKLLKIGLGPKGIICCSNWR